MDAPGNQHDVVLATKLHRPRPRPRFVSRPRLLERLDEGLARGVLLVCTPPGFGKTALLADWAQGGRRPVAWLTVDAGDNDPARFWRHLVAALDPARPGLADRLGPLLGPPAPVAYEGLATALVNQLAGEAGEVLLVLDDYHLIEAQPVHASIGFLLEHRPPGLRLVLASRADPPLPLARLRARGQLAELRQRDLRCTEQEARVVLGQAVGADLPEAAVAALTERTEGWVAGLQLAALSLRGQADVAGFVAGFSGSHRYVLDYLAEEVLDASPSRCGGSCSRPRSWSGCRARCATPSPAATTASGCWSRSSGPTCSWSRWMRCGAGGATTSCSPTCSGPASSSSSPGWCRPCTAGPPPGTRPTS